uniref:alpha-amylase n=1 Tax=Musca domestica TaxID=7370 RepID=A0A1I8MXJ4_MUSDO
MRLRLSAATNQSLATTPHGVAVVVIQILVICLLAQPSLGRTAATRQKALEQILDSGKSRQSSGSADDGDQGCDDADGIYHRPHFTKGRSVMVQLFEWKFVDVAEECRRFLGPRGYGGVQLSPVLEHTVIKTDGLNHPWWQRYETISYRLSSRSGDETDFYSMSRICNDLGVRLYVDVVLNHMAAPLHLLLNNNNRTTKGATAPKQDFIVNTLLATDVNISQSSYPEVPYEAKDFHRYCAINLASSNAQEMRNCQLNGHPDLDHSHSSVRQAIVAMLNKFIDMGVAGFRIDSAKYIWPIDLKLIFEGLKDLNTEYNFPEKARPFIFHDVFDMGLDQISKTEYSTYGVVSEYLYGVEIATILQGKAPLSSLINWGPAMGFLPHQDSLVFIDSPETQRGLPPQLGKNRALTYKQRHKYIMANALMLAHPYGRIKRIMSSYYFRNPDQGPPADEKDGDEIRSPEFNEQQQCLPSSGWVCEHRWPPMLQLVKLANYFSKPGQGEDSVIHFQTNGPNQIAFCRGHKAFVAMNNDAERDFEMEVYTCLEEEGVYCDIVSGGLKKNGQGCRGRSLMVNADGYAKINLPVASESEGDGGLDETEDFTFAPIEDGGPENVEEAGGGEEVVPSYGVLVVYVGSRVGAEIEEEEWEVEVQEIPGDEAGNSDAEYPPIEPGDGDGAEGGGGGEGDAVEVADKEPSNENEGDTETGEAQPDPEPEEPNEAAEENGEGEIGEGNEEDEGKTEEETPPEEKGEDNEVPAEGDEGTGNAENGENFTFSPVEPQEGEAEIPEEEKGKVDEEENVEEVPGEGEADEVEEVPEENPEDEVPPQPQEEDEKEGGEEENAEEEPEGEEKVEEETDEEGVEEENPEAAGDGEEKETGEAEEEQPNPPEEVDGEPTEEVAPNENSEEPNTEGEPVEVPESEKEGEGDEEGAEEPNPEGPEAEGEPEDVPETGKEGEGNEEGADTPQGAEDLAPAAEEPKENPDEAPEDAPENTGRDSAEEGENNGKNEDNPEAEEEPEADNDNPEGDENGDKEPEGNPEEKPEPGEETEANPEAGEVTEGALEPEEGIVDDGEEEENPPRVEPIETTTKCPPKTVTEPEEKLIDKIDKRNAQNGDEDENSDTAQLEEPLEVSESITESPVPPPPETNTQAPQINATVEIISNIGVTEMQIAANNSNAAVKKDDVQVAGVFQSSKNRQGNG